MNLGWVKLHRKLSDNKLWTSEPFTRGQAWVDMLMLANHKEDFFYVRGNRVTVQRGQLGWSQLGLSKRWSWSRGKTKRFLNELEIDQQIVQQNNFISSLIIIVNYEQYQGDGQQTVQRTDSRRTADGQQTDTNKNVKNDKKENWNLNVILGIVGWKGGVLGVGYNFAKEGRGVVGLKKETLSFVFGFNFKTI